MQLNALLTSDTSGHETRSDVKVAFDERQRKSEKENNSLPFSDLSGELPGPPGSADHLWLPPGRIYVGGDRRTRL